MTTLHHRLGMLVAGLALAACSTPQIALDQANNGVRLTQQLQQELLRYRQHAAASAERRLGAVQLQEENGLIAARTRAFEDYLNTRSGQGPGAATSARMIRDASRKYTELAADEDKARQALAERLAGIVKDLPSPGDRLGAVQKALAALGTELSPAERAAIVTKFLDEGKAIVDKNAKAAAAAS